MVLPLYFYILRGTHLAEDFEEGGFSHVLGEIAHVQRGGVVRGDLNEGEEETAAAGTTKFA